MGVSIQDVSILILKNKRAEGCLGMKEGIRGMWKGEMGWVKVGKGGVMEIEALDP